MARRKTLTDNQVAKLRPQSKRYTVPDPECRGHYVRVTPHGVRTYVAVARDPQKKQVWATIESADRIKIEDAREKARETIQRIKAGLPAFEPPAPPVDSFKAVADNWMKRHVEAKGLRSAAEYRRVLDQYVFPEWQDREFESIRRGDVTKLLDTVQDENGARQADYVLATVRAIMNWHASRTDDYVPPIARGMRRTSPNDRKRARLLDDDELRVLWTVAERNGTFGAIVRFALLTAQRRDKVLTLKRSDVSIDGEWSIPSENGEKGNAGWLVLPEMAVDIIRAQQIVEGNDYVFAGRTKGYFKGVSKAKAKLDEKLAKAWRKDNPDAEPMNPWTIHDLRRTARSLMSRAGVRPDIAERVLGHAIAGVEGVYDRHDYRDEKRDALAKLAGLIDHIVHPADNVTPIRQDADATA